MIVSPVETAQCSNLLPYMAISHKALSGPKRTMNIAAFIAACRNLHVPEEEVSLWIHKIMDPNQ